VVSGQFCQFVSLSVVSGQLSVVSGLRS
jgi:hypothetical protein